MAAITAVVTKIVVWDAAALVERIRWEICTSDGRVKRTTTRREALEWCAEQGAR